MKKTFLLPQYFRWIGVFFLLVFLCLVLYSLAYGLELKAKTFVLLDGSPSFSDDIGHFMIKPVDMALTLFLLTSLLGLVFIAFSRNRHEDEMINSIRLYAWSLAILSTVLLTLFCIIFIYGSSYLYFSLFTLHALVLFYILIFYFQLYKLNRRSTHEE